MILLAYVENLQETWLNMRIVLELLGLGSIKYRLAADLKLINILLGISCHSGKFACYICFGLCGLVCGPLRSFQHLADMYAAYPAAGFPHKKMAQFYNVIKPCLINPANLSILIGDHIPIPELHCHMGVGNWCWDLVKVCTTIQSIFFCTELCCSRLDNTALLYLP